MRKQLSALAAASLALLIFWLIPRTALSRPPEEVVVSNLPDIVPIKGEVTVLGTVRQASMVRRLGVIVPPVGRDETESLVEVDPVETDGFTGIALSLQGDVRGTVGRDGAVGAVLVPDEEPILETMRKEGLIQLPLEVAATLSREQRPEFSAREHQALSFPRYRIYLYNSTDRTIDLNLYLYLTQ